MSSVKASLKVVLLAEKVVVAESEDAQLWQRVLAAIQDDGGADTFMKQVHRRASGVDGESKGENKAESKSKSPDASSSSGIGALAKFSGDIGATVEEVESACAPSTGEPYLILDHDAWAKFKSQLGDRGPLAVSPVVVAATLLALWFKSSNGQANATQAQAQAILKSINVRDSNPGRGIRRSDWLQPRAGGQIIINPTKMTKAKLFAKCFCTQNWTAWKGG